MEDMSGEGFLQHFIWFSCLPSCGDYRNRWTAFFWHTNLLRTLLNSFWAFFRKSKNFIISNFFRQKRKILKFRWKNVFFSKVSLSHILTAQQITFRALHRARDNSHIYTSRHLSGISTFTLLCRTQVQHFSSISQKKYTFLPHQTMIFTFWVKWTRHLQGIARETDESTRSLRSPGSHCGVLSGHMVLSMALPPSFTSAWALWQAGYRWGK